MLKYFIEMLRFEKIREINARYSKRSVALTPGTRTALFLLRIYIVAMLGLLGIKFYQILTGGGM